MSNLCLLLDTDAQVTAVEAMLIEKYKPILNIQYKTDASPLFDIEPFCPEWISFDKTYEINTEIKILEKIGSDIFTEQLKTEHTLFLQNMSDEEKIDYANTRPLYLECDEKEYFRITNGAPDDLITEHELGNINKRKGLCLKEDAKIYFQYDYGRKTKCYSLNDFEPIKYKYRDKDYFSVCRIRNEEAKNFLYIYDHLIKTAMRKNICTFVLNDNITPELPCRLEYFDEKTNIIYQMGAYQRKKKRLSFYLYEPRITEDGRKITSQMALEQMKERCIAALESIT